jgi:CelD/BcsL family acetyltransferase involved in cellulose biosynthesis
MTGRTTAPGDRTASVEAGGWSVEIRRTDDGLAGLCSEWDDLFGRCGAATPFQSYVWLESWWRTYGAPGRLRLILIRYGGRLVAAAPLMLRRRAGGPVLTPIGGTFSDFTDVLADDAMAAPAARVLAETLIREPGWQAIDFPETRPGAVAGAALWDAWPGARWQTRASLCLELPAMPMEDLVRDLPTHSRKTVRRRLNQLKRVDVDIREVAAGDADRAVADLLRLHALQWQGRGVNRHHLTPAFADHLTRTMRAMIGSGEAVLLEYRIAGRLMASSLVLVGPDLVGGYLYGADPALREQVDVSTLLLADTLPMAYRLGRPTMSMLRGAEQHKMRWRPRESQNRQILLARPGSVRGTVYVTGMRAVRTARRTAKERAPWLRTVRDRVRRSLAAARPASAQGTSP